MDAPSITSSQASEAGSSQGPPSAQNPYYPYGTYQHYQPASTHKPAHPYYYPAAQGWFPPNTYYQPAVIPPNSGLDSQVIPSLASERTSASASQTTATATPSSNPNLPPPPPPGIPSQTQGEFPAVTAPPPLPSKPWILSSTSDKISTDGLRRELVMIEGRIETLQHNSDIAASQTMWLYNAWKKTQEDLQRTKEEADQRINLLERRLSKMESTLDNGNGEDDEDTDSDEEPEAKLPPREETLSLLAADHSSILQLTNVMFCYFLGISSLGKRDQFPVINNNEGPLPFVYGSEEVRQVRFQWEENGKDPDNYKSIQTIARFARSHGNNYVSGVDTYLKLVSEGDLIERLTKKYNYLRKVWKGTAHKKTFAPFLNRARGKLEVRERKRDLLPKESQWRDSRYDAAFAVQLMSDDEDSIDVNGDPLPAPYISRAPLWRSAELSALWDAIDQVKDPRQSRQYVERIRGDPKVKEPSETKNIAGRARRWMVDLDWLKDHPDLDHPSRICDNGTAWGDPKDPEDIELREKQVKLDKKENAKKRKEMSLGTVTATTRKKARTRKGNKKSSQKENDNDLDFFA